MRRVWVALPIFLSVPVIADCKTADLEPKAAEVAAGRNPPPPGCTSRGYITGKGGGTFGGGWISNEKLIEYALNDLRNQAAELGANYVQHDTPQLGEGDGTTTSVTITGTAYMCDRAVTPAGDAAPIRKKSSDREAAKEGGAKPKAGPPDGAVGFAFGQSTDEASTACASAGHKWSDGGADHFRCSGTPTDFGLTADALLRFCEAKLCAVMVTAKPASDDGKVWSKAFVQIREALTKKYGKPEKGERAGPECADGKLYQCLLEDRARLAADWSWPTGESISLLLSKPAEPSAPMGIRIVYRKPNADAPALQGL